MSLVVFNHPYSPNEKEKKSKFGLVREKTSKGKVAEPHSILMDIELPFILFKPPTHTHTHTQINWFVTKNINLQDNSYPQVLP